MNKNQSLTLGPQDFKTLGEPLLSKQALWHFYGSDYQYLASVNASLRDAIVTGTTLAGWRGEKRYLTSEPRVVEVHPEYATVADGEGKSYEDCLNWMDEIISWLRNTPEGLPASVKLGQEAFRCPQVSQGVQQRLRRVYPEKFYDSSALTIERVVGPGRTQWFLFTDRYQ